MRSRSRTLQGDMQRIVANLDRRWVRAASGVVNVALNELFDEVFENRLRMVVCFGTFPATGPNIASFLLKWSAKVPVYVPRITSLHSAPQGYIRIQDPSQRLTEDSYLLNDDLNLRIAEEDVSSVALLIPVSACDQDGGWCASPVLKVENVLSSTVLASRCELIGVGWSIQLVPEVKNSLPKLNWICHERGFLEVTPQSSYDQGLFSYEFG